MGVDTPQFIREPSTTSIVCILHSEFCISPS
jgi:hypothetical protein